ncbi:hypothetical protein ZWY2020_048093 [Hordeum vulgare]|nr:hypothetical protein ZWY2020_048093 [Hordeum vulgare]
MEELLLRHSRASQGRWQPAASRVVAVALRFKAEQQPRRPRVSARDGAGPGACPGPRAAVAARCRRRHRSSPAPRRACPKKTISGARRGCAPELMLSRSPSRPLRLRCGSLTDEAGVSAEELPRDV